MRLSDFIPPVIHNASRGWRRWRANKGHHRAVFATYDEAALQCAAFGYETRELVNTVYLKTARYRDKCGSEGPVALTPADTLALFGIGLAHRTSAPTINVIDFGGACGAHYFLIKSLLGDRLRFNWHVVETRAMVERAADLQTAELKFFVSIEQAAAELASIDLAYSSGTLPFVPDALKSLTQLLATRPAFVVLARLGVTQRPKPVVTIHETRLSHNGPGPMPPGLQDGVTRYPYTFPVQAEIESILTQHHKIILQAPDGSGVFPVNDERLLGVGYVAEYGGDDPHNANQSLGRFR